jgi:hypothetical protein
LTSAAEAATKLRIGLPRAFSRQIKTEFEMVCHKALRPIDDRPKSIDYYIINAHRLGVPVNGTGGDKVHSNEYPLYRANLTAAFFFRDILAAKNRVKDDRSAICAWSGADKGYCAEAKQTQMLQAWMNFRSTRTRQ